MKSFPLWIGGLLVLLSGCGGGGEGPELGRVTGVVKVNGTPTAGLMVTFQPPDGPAASGTTDSSGAYRLLSPGDRAGTQLGMNSVRITGRDADASDELLSEIAAEQQTTVEALKETPVIPERYNEATELERDVQPGSNQFDFDLEI